MTEITKGLREAKRDIILCYFEEELRKSLAERINQSVSDPQSFIKDFPKITCRNLNSLDPKRQIEILEEHIEDQIDSAVTDGMQKTLQLMVNNNCTSNGVNKIFKAMKLLQQISQQAFQMIVDKVVEEYLSQELPPLLFRAAQRTYEAAFALEVFCEICDANWDVEPPKEVVNRYSDQDRVNNNHYYNTFLCHVESNFFPLLINKLKSFYATSEGKARLLQIVYKAACIAHQN